MLGLIQPLLTNVGVDYGNTTELIPGVLNGQLVTMGILMLIELALNIAGINLVALLNQVSVWWHIAIVAAVVVLVFLAGKPDASGLTPFAIQPQDVGGSWANNIGPITMNPLQMGNGTAGVYAMPAYDSLIKIEPNGKLTPDEKRAIEYAFQLYQNKLLHGPIAALQDASRAGDAPSLLDAIKKLFRLGE